MPPLNQISRNVHDRNGRWYRVIERRPRPGDIHPLSVSDIRAVLDELPVRFTYGITTVELCPRVGEIGKPFGFYSPREKSITIYSVPAGEWLVRNRHNVQNFYQWYGAVTFAEGDKLRVKWEDTEPLKFKVCWTLLHECGHHYDNQYRCRRPYPKDKRDHERSAEAHAFRMSGQHCIQELFSHLDKKDEEPAVIPEAELPARPATPAAD